MVLDGFGIGGEAGFEGVGDGAGAIQRQHGIEAGEGAGLQQPGQKTAVGRGDGRDGAVSFFEMADVSPACFRASRTARGERGKGKRARQRNSEAWACMQ